MTLRLLAILACSTFSLLAQETPEARAAREVETSRKQRLMEAMERKAAGEGGSEDNPDGDDGKLGKGGVEQPPANALRNGAPNLCRFVAGVKPAKLMPGQTGTLVVTAVLQGDAVMPVPAPLEVSSAPQQGLLSVGAPSFQPAGPAKHAKAYAGRPAYDNYVLFELPITVAADAKVGSKQRFNLEMKFDLFDGNTAQPLGKFLDRAGVEVEIGRAADPAVSFPTAPAAQVPAAAAPPAAAPAAPTDAGAAAAGQPAAALGGTAAVASVPAAAPAAPEPSAAPAVLPTEDEGLPVALLAGGGALVLGLLVVLLRRR